MKWIKLVKVDGKGGGKTRIISIRKRLLEEAGVDPQAELQGYWEPVQSSKKLILHIKETRPSSREGPNHLTDPPTQNQGTSREVQH